MPEDEVSLPKIAIELKHARPSDMEAIQAAIRLGDTARSTLGLLPHSAYHQAAANGTLLLALRGGEVVGYALYGLARTRNRVRLTHLCVDPAYRRQGIASRMVDYISEQRHDYLGIAVRCRQSYRLDRMWAQLGFAQRTERPGRSREGHTLVDWWRDHYHPHLFRPDPDTVLVRAAIDLNILRDFAEPERSGGSEATGLLTEALVGRLELIRTPALNIEIADMEERLRRLCTQQAQSLTEARADRGAVSRLEDVLTAAARQVEPSYPVTKQDRHDLAHVAHAIACSLTVFITRDERLIDVLGPPAEEHGLRIMRPGDVVVHLDELLRAEAYRPVELHRTTYVQRMIRSDRDHDLLPLVNTVHGETPRRLTRTLRLLAAERRDRMGVFKADGDLVALFSAHAADGALAVPLLRVANLPYADTIAQQTLFNLRQRARDAGCFVLRITDACPSPPIRRAALSDGYQEANGDLVAYTLAVVGTVQEVSHKAVMAARGAGLPEPPTLRSSMPAMVAAEMERIWWPVKLIDSELPTYLVPIQQAFSTELLGVPEALLPRSDSLGLSREHVYYRSPQGPRPAAPARLVWYMSRGGPTTPTPAGIVACSHLEAVVDGRPDELHSRFQHLGVWNKEAISKAARGGVAQALRFANTELFPKPISLGRFQQLARAHGVPGTAPQGPRKVPAELFSAIYQEGRNG